MNKILSWKINNASYAYIFPTNGTYISNAISEDSPLWANIIGEISTWTLDTYKSNFNKMAAEVKNKFGVTIPWKDEYWDLGVDGSIGGVNIIMLSGKGGDGDGYGSGEIGPEVYEEFNKMIDAELQKAREAIEKKNAEVKAFVEAKVTDTISAAKQTIAETKAEIDETRDELEGKLAGATEALNKAAELFELGEGGIDGEAIKDVMNSVSAHTTWLNTYSGAVADFQTDYDIATQRLGEMTVASSVTDGLFSRFATSMNVMSGTVGSVERTMDAASGVIKDAAEWIDTNKDSVANVTRYISASAAVIEDKVKYIDNDLTSVIERTVDGKNATIRDEIKAETASGLTNVRNEMNALSGSILQELTHYAPDSAITSIGSEMEAMSATMSTWITKTDSAMSMTHDLREEWSIESGKISTVTNLVAKTDANGEVEYWVSGETGNLIKVNRYEVNPKYWIGEDGNLYEDSRVFVEYSDTLGSYIQQEVSSITMSVMGKDNMTAAIQLAVKEDAENGGKAIINMVADKVVISADMIAGAISAKTANIGGIMIGNGIVECMSTIVSGGQFENVVLLPQRETIEFKVKQNENGEWLLDEPLSDENVFINNTDYKFYYSAGTTDDKSPSYLFLWEVEEIEKDGSYYWYHMAPITPTSDIYTKEEVDGLFFSGETMSKEPIKKPVFFNSIIKKWEDEDGNYYEDDIVTKNEIFTSLPKFKLDGHDGTLSAYNAKIYGDIYAEKGSIGGMKLEDHMLKVYSENEEYGSYVIALINGSDTLKNDKYDKLIFASGIDMGRYYYKFKNNEGEEIFTKQNYLKENINENLIVDVYKPNIKNTFSKYTEDCFYYTTDTVFFDETHVLNEYDFHEEYVSGTSYSLKCLCMPSVSRTSYTILARYGFMSDSKINKNGDIELKIDKDFITIYMNQPPIERKYTNYTLKVYKGSDGYYYSFCNRKREFKYEYYVSTDFQTYNRIPDKDVTEEIINIAYYSVRPISNGKFVDGFSKNEFDDLPTYSEDRYPPIKVDSNGYVYVYGRMEIFTEEGITESTPEYIPCVGLDEIKIGVTDVYKWKTGTYIDKAQVNYYPDYNYVLFNTGEKIYIDENNTFINDGLTHNLLFKNHFLQFIINEDDIEHSYNYSVVIDNNEVKLHKILAVVEMIPILLVEETDGEIILKDNNNNEYLVSDETLTLNGILYYGIKDSGYYWNGNTSLCRIKCDEVTLEESMYPLTLNIKNNFKVQSDDYEELSNVKIYGDGSVFLKKLFVEDGEYKGYIDANGKFKGELETNGGTIENTDVHVNSLHGTIAFSDNDIIQAQHSGSTFFEIVQDDLSDTVLDTVVYCNSYSRNVVNSNGENSGQWYNSGGEIRLCSFKVKSGATVSMENITGNLYRFAPKRHKNESATFSVIYKYNNEEVAFDKDVFDAFWGEGDSNKSIDFKSYINGETFSADTTIDIYISYSIHLSTYYFWLFGLDKANFSLNINKAKCTINYPEQPSGLYIAPNGFKILTDKGIDARFYDDNIWLCSNGNGIVITKDGMKTVQNNQIK